LKASDGLQINQNIRVTRAGEEEWYVSSVQDLSESEFSISIPTRGHHPLNLQRGDQVKISFITQASRFEFETKVTGWHYDNIPMYALLLPKKMKRVQLREFVRIPIMMDAYYAEVPGDGEEPVFVKCASLDLSGGGMKLLLQKDYPAGAKLIIKFNIPSKNGVEEMEVTGSVIRNWPAENSNSYQVAIQFLKISRRQQDAIVRFVLAKMSEQRRLS
jgi:c-di-GMP-binding flagellar brake protein YcgR